MSIPIEGLAELGTNQEKNSSLSERYRLIQDSILDRVSQGGRRRGNRFQSYLLAGLTLTSPLIAACGTAVRAGDRPTTPEVTAEAFTQQNPDASKVNIPGVGKVGIEPTPESAVSGEPPAEAQKPSTPDVKAETTPCLITSPELCAQAERIQIIRASGRTETYITFNPDLKPDQKIPFFAPEDGRLLDKIEESGDPFSGLSATLYKPNPPGGAYIIIGLEFDNMLQVKDPKKGSLIGYSNSSGITNFGAKVLVRITKRTPEGPTTDEDALRELFPNAFKKPIKQTFSQQTPGIPNVSISYSPNPPQ